ncbi:MAG: fliJ [Bacillales bacterium]|jgi:flagellar FliJ protein|nr:fliJ [Bacillales bacterium]
MKFNYKFEKILNLKAQEKDSVLKQYEEAKSIFENVANKLYEYLLKKEELINTQENLLLDGLTIYEIKQQQLYIQNIEKLISDFQTRVIEARHNMQMQEQILIEKNIEVKKYEIMKDKSFVSYLEQIKLLENTQMDEISIQQHLNKANR